MRRWAWILMVTVGVLGGAHCAYANTRVQVLQTFPSGHDITLARYQDFYVHLHYDTDHPVGIWVQPYFEGKEVNAGFSPSRSYNGRGEALGWFFLFKPNTQVDEVRITAGDGSFAGTPVVATYRVHITGSDRPATTRDKPAWVAQLTARDAAAEKVAYDTQMSTPVSAGDFILGDGIMLVMLAIGLLGFFAPARAVWRWRGGWRVAALVPAMMMTFVILRLCVGVARDATSHNLWPLEIVQAGALSVAIMIGLLLARKLTGTGRAS